MLGPKSICSISWIGGVIIGLKAAPSLRDGFDQLPKSRATTQVFSIHWIERCMNSWQGCISSNEEGDGEISSTVAHAEALSYVFGHFLTCVFSVDPGVISQNGYMRVFRCFYNALVANTIIHVSFSSNLNKAGGIVLALIQLSL